MSADHSLANRMFEEQETIDESEPHAGKASGFRFTIKQLAIAIVIIAALLACWMRLSHKPFRVRPAHEHVANPNRYFGIDEQRASVRTIALVEGTFAKQTRLLVLLSVVERGQITDMAQLGLGRTSNQVPSPWWQDLKMTLALGSVETARGRVVQLGSLGHSRGSGSVNERPINFGLEFSRHYNGKIRPGRKYIVYAEGDTEINLEPDMTISEFATRNQGNYLVVEIEVR